MDRYNEKHQTTSSQQQARHDPDLVRLIDGRAIAIYLHDGMAYVAELKGGRARISSLGAWLGANQNGRILRASARAAESSGALARLAAAIRERWAAVVARRHGSRDGRAVAGSAVGRP
jgi:hypothetical protein